MPYSLYYQATVARDKTWFLVATVRSFEHLLFDRALDKHIGLFEFFVASDFEHYFLEIMNHFEKIGIVSNIQKLPNRLQTPGEKL